MGDESGGDAGEDIAHASGGHAGMAGGVVGGRGSAFADEGARAFEQERDGILADKGLQLLAACAGFLRDTIIRLSETAHCCARLAGMKMP